MSPMGWPLISYVGYLNSWSVKAVDHWGVLVSVQSSLSLPSIQSMTIPDIAWLDKKIHYGPP